MGYIDNYMKSKAEQSSLTEKEGEEDNLCLPK